MKLKDLIVGGNAIWNQTMKILQNGKAGKDTTRIGSV